jgi:hypothetical protein
MKILIPSLLALIMSTGLAGAQEKTPEQLKWEISQQIISHDYSLSKDGEYCECYATNVIDEWISNVSFAGIDNNSGTSGYSDFTQFTGEVEVGEEYPVSVTIVNNTGVQWTETVRIWIDWNQDFEFGLDEYYDLDDLGVVVIPANSSYDFTSVIQVPVDAAKGITRMRVVLSWNTYRDSACGVFGFGEVEDYSIMVGPPPVPLSNAAWLVSVLSIFAFVVIRRR